MDPRWSLFGYWNESSVSLRILHCTRGWGAQRANSGASAALYKIKMIILRKKSFSVLTQYHIYDHAATPVTKYLRPDSKCLSPSFDTHFRIHISTAASLLRPVHR
jgi:hypothetical protein